MIFIYLIAREVKKSQFFLYDKSNLYSQELNVAKSKIFKSRKDKLSPIKENVNTLKWHIYSF